MHVKWVKGLLLVAIGASLLLAPTGFAEAACPGVISHLFSAFTNCGPAPNAYFWHHGRGVQRIIASNTNGAAATAAGADSGINQSGPAMYLPFTDPGSGQVVPNAWQANTDFGNQDMDGCIFNVFENATSCTPGGTDFGVFDYVIAGVDPAAPNVTRIGAASVDFNETFQGWLVDNAGAPNVDNNPCQGNATSLGPDIPCSPIPVPRIASTGACTTAGCTINVAVDDISQLVAQSIKDDCVIAETNATNCPRGFYQGRVLVFKHGACSTSAAAGFDRRSFVMPGPLASGTAVVTPNFFNYSREDANLSGTLDAGEDGTNGGASNGRLDPFVIPGTACAGPAAAGQPSCGNPAIQVPVPAVVGANDCIFIGMGILFDAGGLSVNPPTNTIFGETVISPGISLNTNPIRAGSATPVPDQVTDIVASKTGGKGKVDWTTGIETTTSGFNVIGTKKGGSGNEVKINSALVTAKEGTTGKGASYTLTFDASQLKGSSAVYIEVVKTNGSKERFGPASF
jgi:hypothetical protein